MLNKKLLLIICDGWGHREDPLHNAIASANTSNFDKFWGKFPHAILAASGESIGLPEGQMGTSEANHLIIGSGRIIYQNLLKINHAIKSGKLGENVRLREALAYVRQKNSALHIMGLASPGGVHSHIDHIKELANIAKKFGITQLYFHLFTDGRDTPPKSARLFIEDFLKFINGKGIGEIASIGGRYWGMDRDNNQDRIEKHFDAIARAKAAYYNSPLEVIEESYNRNVTDEFIEPAVMASYKNKGIKENDAVIFANFRADRAKQLTARFLEENISGLHYLSMTKYFDELKTPVMFPPEEINNVLSETISGYKLPQIKITETEKFTHLTFYFNAQKYEAHSLEERFMIPTNKDVATHDEKPEMKAFEIAEAINKAMDSEKYSLLCANIVNCDMVGHSGNLEATIKAVEAVDKSLGLIIDKARKKRIDVIITADHGNAEGIFDPISNQPHTAHTLNPVPFILISNAYDKINRENGMLSDIAPTILKSLGLPVPSEMTGVPFI